MKARRFADNDSRHGFISIIPGKMAEFVERGACSGARGLYGKNDHIRMKAAVIFLSLSLILAGASLLPATSHQAYSPSTTHKASTSIAADEAGLPNLQGEKAVEHLRKQGLYSSLQEAMTAARYRVYADDQGKSDYYADNPALRMGMRFDDGAMRLMVKRPVAQSKAEQSKDAKATALLDSKPRYRTTEASLRLIGAGYGNRILQTTGNAEMTVDANRFTYHHHLENSAVSYQPSAISYQPSAVSHQTTGSSHSSRIADLQSAIRNPQSAIEEWYINRAEGIEHGFTLNNPPMERDGDEPLRVEMEFGGGFKLRAKPDGKGIVLSSKEGLALSYDKLKVIDATGKELESVMKVRGRRVSIEVSDLEASYPVTIDPLIDTEVVKLLSSDIEAGDFFSAVAISGDTAIVGAFGEDMPGTQSGAAYIFERNRGGANLWGEVRKIRSSDIGGGDFFGAEVAISGDTVIVGASGEDTGGFNAGAAYIFERNAGGPDNWGQVQKLKASDPQSNDQFGNSVSISGDTAIVGAREEDTGGNSAGSAYIFERNFDPMNPGTPLADNWGQVAKIQASNRGGGDQFGQSVSISGDTVIVGAEDEDSGGNGAGAAYIFERNFDPMNPGTPLVNNWGEVAMLLASDAQGGDLFGHSVSISGDTAVVGSVGEDTGGNEAGAAYIFERNQGGPDNWGEVRKIQPFDVEGSDRFANSVSISGDTIIGGSSGDDTNGNMAGAAYIFQRNQGGANNWGEASKLLASDGEAGDQFGLLVSISGDTAIVGAFSEDTGGADAGAAYIFTSLCDQWVEVTKSQASDPEANDEFGTSVSISGDTAIVGASDEDTGGAQAGAAYIFERNKGGVDNWGEITKIQASDIQGGDLFGASVSISGDTAIVGAFHEGTGGSQAGAAYIFERDQGGVDNWGEVRKIQASDRQAFDQFGTSVSISGDTAIVGTPRKDTGGNNAGAAYIFERNQGGADNWGEVRKIQASDREAGDFFGTSVSISGDTAIVGSEGEGVSGSNEGAAYIFERNEGGADNWGEARKIRSSDREAGDFFGTSVSISGDTAIVGAFHEDTGGSNAGAAYIFGRNQGGADNWGEVRKIQASDRQADDLFGASVSISGDTAIVGARAEDTGGFQAGAAYIFGRNQGGADNWGEADKIESSDIEAFDFFGHSVSISEDTVIVSARGEDTGSADAGAAYLFTLNCPPTISTQPVSVERDSTNAAATIATVSDDLTPAASLSVTVASSPAGISVTNLINTDGTITADLSADCSAPLGANTVTLSVMDEHGFVSMADMTVNVSAETTPPIINCPTDLMVGTDAGQYSAVVNFTATANDTCDGAITPVCAPASGATFPVGATTVNCVATDAAGNTTECGFFVTVTDDDAPTVTCPSPITVNNDTGQCSATVNFTATANDNCDGAITPVCSPASGVAFPVGITTVTCTATDAAGNTDNCSFTVTVTDTEAPVVTCPSPITVSNDAGQCSAAVNFTATANDNCDGAITPVCAPVSGSAFPVGTTTVNCSVKDTAGNASNCSFTVTVNDTQPPSINCPSPIARTNDPGLCGASVNFTVTASDNCPGVRAVACVPPSGATFPVGTTTVNCSVQDAAGNLSNCLFPVIINDIEDPTMTCPTSLIVTTTIVGNPNVVFNYSAPAVADNCSVASVVCNPPSGSAFPLGTTTVNCAVTDTSGNTAHCSFAVTAFDVCLEDDNDPSKALMFISTGPQKGDYLFCCGGQTVSGRGSIGVKGGTISLTHFTSERRVQGFLRPSSNSGSAAMQSPPTAFPCAISDSNTTNNACVCAGG